MRITIPGKPFNIVCKEQGLPEFPEMLFGVSTDNGMMYFNASSYLRSIGKDLKVADFLSSYDIMIQSLQESYSIKDDEVCRIDMEGNYLIEVEFIYIFICFTDHLFMGHVNEKLNDLFTDGFAVSDTYLFHAAKSRFSNDMIKQMMTDDGQKVSK